MNVQAGENKSESELICCPSLGRPTAAEAGQCPYGVYKSTLARIFESKRPLGRAFPSSIPPCPAARRRLSKDNSSSSSVERKPSTTNARRFWECLPENR